MDIPTLNMFCAAKNLIFIEFSVVDELKGMRFKDFKNNECFYTPKDIERILKKKPHHKNRA